MDTTPRRCDHIGSNILDPYIADRRKLRIPVTNIGPVAGAVGDENRAGAVCHDNIAYKNIIHTTAVYRNDLDPATHHIVKMAIFNHNVNEISAGICADLKCAPVGADAAIFDMDISAGIYGGGF